MHSNDQLTYNMSFDRLCVDGYHAFFYVWFNLFLSINFFQSNIVFYLEINGFSIISSFIHVCMCLARLVRVMWVKTLTHIHTIALIHQLAYTLEFSAENDQLTFSVSCNKWHWDTIGSIWFRLSCLSGSRRTWFCRSAASQNCMNLYSWKKYFSQ